MCKTNSNVIINQLNIGVNYLEIDVGKLLKAFKLSAQIILENGAETYRADGVLTDKKIGIILKIITFMF